ncbi:hypothetical protein DL96DRAFT_1816700 [Flagelloscypha sp. PMI_526]|nr:hypothetical protein DL96DRAFT_1816700 [Flagelloscypha sp. PMI_526]
MDSSSEHPISLHALPPELWARVCLALVDLDCGTGENARVLSLTCRLFHDFIRLDRWKTIALRDFDRIVRFTHMLVDTPEASPIRKIENLFVLFSDDWFGEMISGLMAKASVTSEERQELEEDTAWFSEQTPADATSLFVEGQESFVPAIYPVHRDGRCRYYLDLGQLILQISGPTLKHLHWHTNWWWRVGKGISLPSYIHLPKLQTLVTSRSSSSVHSNDFWNDREANELVEHLLWGERSKPLDLRNDGDVIPCLEIHLPALRILHIGLPVAHRPPLDYLPNMGTPGQPVELTEAWFNRFRDVVLKGCPSLQLFGLSYLDKLENNAEWCPPQELSYNRLCEMYSKLMHPNPYSPLEVDYGCEICVSPTAYEVFDLWRRFLNGQEQGLYLYSFFSNEIKASLCSWI